jgi:hypothetical protein
MRLGDRGHQCVSVLCTVSTDFSLTIIPKQYRYTIEGSGNLQTPLFDNLGSVKRDISSALQRKRALNRSDCIIYTLPIKILDLMS